MSKSANMKVRVVLIVIEKQGGRMPNYDYIKRPAETSHKRGDGSYKTESSTPASLNFLENIFPKIVSKKMLTKKLLKIK